MTRYRAVPESYALPQNIRRIFDTAGSFRTLAGHAAHAIQTLGIPATDAPQVQNLFREFEQRRMLLSEAEFLAALHSHKHDETVPAMRPEDHSLASVSVITSCADNARGTVASIEEHLRMAGRSLPVRVFTNGDRDLASDLLAAGLPEDPVSFGLSDDEQVGWAEGANRNGWLLLTQGELALSCDDDALWQIYGKPSGTEVALGSARPAIPMPYASTTPEPAHQIDLLAEHERLLGHRINDCLRDGCWLDSDVPISDALLNSAMGGTGRVTTTQAGLVGDCAFGAPTNWLLNRSGRSQLLNHYEQVLSDRKVVMIAPRATITDHPNFMGYAFGLDNRRLVPPFLPVCRNGDGIFRTLLRRMSESYLCGYLPYGLFHSPHEERTWRKDASEQDLETQPATADVIRLWIDSCPKEAGSPEEELKRVGRHLLLLGSMPLPDYEALLRPRLLERAHHALTRFESLLREHGRQPQCWAEDCDRCIRALVYNMNRPDLTTPRELRNPEDPLAASAKAQRFVRRFGNLLVHWHDMRTAAYKFKERWLTSTLK